MIYETAAVPDDIIHGLEKDMRREKRASHTSNERCDKDFRKKRVRKKSWRR